MQQFVEKMPILEVYGFVEEQALDAAIDVFREHGFEGTSAEMLVRALGIGRQSLYDTFGDKWRIYLSSVRRYVGAIMHTVAVGEPSAAERKCDCAR